MSLLAGAAGECIRKQGPLSEDLNADADCLFVYIMDSVTTALSTFNLAGHYWQGRQVNALESWVHRSKI